MVIDVLQLEKEQLSHYNSLWSVATRDVSAVLSGDGCSMKTTPSNIIKMFGSNSASLYFSSPAHKDSPKLATSQIFGLVAFVQFRIAADVGVSSEWRRVQTVRTPRRTHSPTVAPRVKVDCLVFVRRTC